MRNEVTWCTDGSTFIRDGTRYAGAAVTTEDRVIWEETLPLGTSAQRAELIALTKAVQLGRIRHLTSILIADTCALQYVSMAPSTGKEGY